MSSVPPSKKARTKSSSRKAKPSISQTAQNEVLIDSEPASTSASKNARYAEPSSLAVHSGVELGEDQAMEDLAASQVEGALDADLAELSLGQRLAAISGDARPSSDSEEEQLQSPRKQKQETPNVIPAHSLTRTLIQALHSSDSRLLETCLAHSDPAMVRNTVRRLPPQLAVPLLTACVERLGRGPRAASMKGGGGGASSQRGTGLVTWVKTVLAVHSGHLMTMPDLVSRLSGLHATLTSRLALQDSLLSLNGRLDMVLSQIEMRSSTAPTLLAPHKNGVSTASQGERQPTRYVEGESEEEGMEVGAESGEDEGSVEDIELGGESEAEETDEEGSDEEDEEDSDGEGPTLNGFIDDEAEEFEDDEEDDESE
ncbi:NUC189-domain-containing protein [Suillus decipiens]|nr:NUC189-domain-containing protein [Suillus decipiens]